MTRPLAAELAFGFATGLAAVPLRLPDGRSVRFRGKADRVDIGMDGTIYVADYKTGSSRNFKDLSPEDPTVRGTKLQLPVYGVAAQLHQVAPDAPVVAEFWFVTEKGGFGRKGIAVTPDVLDAVGHTLATMVDGIEGGVFPNRPTTMSTFNVWIDCHPCEPDALGVVELRRAWDRKRRDPALAPYADFAEPDGAAEAEADA